MCGTLWCTFISLWYNSTIVNINWEKFSVKIFLLVQPPQKLNSQILFDSVNLWYEKNVCDVHIKTPILNTSSVLAWISSLVVLIRDVNLKLFQAEGWAFRSRMIVVNMFANTIKWSPLQTMWWRRPSVVFCLTTMQVNYCKLENICVTNFHVINYCVKKFC